jgi:hypothetical protein
MGAAFVGDWQTACAAFFALCRWQDILRVAVPGVGISTLVLAQHVRRQLAKQRVVVGREVPKMPEAKLCGSLGNRRGGLKPEPYCIQTQRVKPGQGTHTPCRLKTIL